MYEKIKNWSNASSHSRSGISWLGNEESIILQGQEQASVKIKKNSDKTNSILYFSEGSYLVADDVLTDFGLSSLEIAAGEYELLYSPTNFGTVSLDISSYTGSLSSSSSQVTFRVASRKKNCNGGFGLRCGRLSGGGTGEPSSFEGTLTPDLDNMKMHVEFEEYADWSLYED